MRVLSWNINGIRANAKETSIRNLLASLNADILCFQETKVTRDQLDESLAIVDGYSAYYSFSKVKQGYSGVATYCKNDFTPIAAEEGLSGEMTSFETIGCHDNISLTPSEAVSLDNEGRAVLTEHQMESGKSVVIVNVYCPRACREEQARMEYKIMFQRVLAERCRSLIESGKEVLLLGDMNAVHKPIDCCEPEMATFENSPSNEWMKSLIRLQPDGGDDEECGFLVDCFRQFHPNRHDGFTCWATITGARKTNYGRRLDYVLSSPKFFASHVKGSDLLTEIEGSDHCPVYVDVEGKFLPAPKPPSLCTQHLPEFAGKQVKLLKYLTYTNPNKRRDEEKKQGQGTATKKPRQSNLLGFVREPKKKTKKEPIFKAEPEAIPSSKSTTSTQALEWQKLMKGPKPAPLCKGHTEPCVIRTVKKVGPNLHRQFYCCARPQGAVADREARCDHFEWATGVKIKKTLLS